MKHIFALLVILFVLSPSAASADQYMRVSEESADMARDYISDSLAIYEYCVPCGDITWKHITAGLVEIERAEDKEHYEVLVNGKVIDLAYTYVLFNERWVNLAMLMGLEVDDTGSRGIVIKETPFELPIDKNRRFEGC